MPTGKRSASAEASGDAFDAVHETREISSGPSSKNAGHGGESDTGKKKRKTAASSRGVANLTPEQLAKKRANDREAQRAIRERTKGQIETLERRIKELTSQQPYQELQNALHQRDLVEAENAEIKKRLAQVVALIQPVLGDGSVENGGRSNRRGKAFLPSYDDEDPAYSRSPLTTAYGGGGITSANSEPYSPAGGGVSALPRQHSSQWHTSMPPLAEAHLPNLRPDTRGGGGAVSIPRGRSSDQLPALLRTTSSERLALGLMPTGADRGGPQGSSSGASSHGGSGSAAVHNDHTAEHLPADSHITLSSTSHLLQPQQQQQQQQQQQRRRQRHKSEASPFSASTSSSPYNTLPANTSPTCPLDGLLLDFLTERRRLASAGATELDLIGPAYPDFSFFMLPPQQRKEGGHRVTSSISQLLTDVIQTFPDICATAEKVATFYGMFMVLRWLACPTQANFDRLPLWIRPTSWQVLTPHPAWIDHLPWPEMREELTKNYTRYPFEEFFVPFTKTMSVNWPYGEEHIFVEGSGPALQMTQMFEEHMRELDNWSVGMPFFQAFPYLAGNTIRVVDK